MQKHFGIAIAAKTAAMFFQFRAQRLEVIDRAIEHDPYRTVESRHRLRSGIGKIENCQTAMSQHGSG